MRLIARPRKALCLNPEASYHAQRALSSFLGLRWAFLTASLLRGSFFVFEADGSFDKGSENLQRKKMNVGFNDPEWEEKHAATYDALLEQLRALIKHCEGMPLELIDKVVSNHDPRIRKRDTWVNLLYGPRELFVEDGQLQCDLRGIIYTPIMRRGRVLLTRGAMKGGPRCPVDG